MESQLPFPMLPSIFTTIRQDNLTGCLHYSNILEIRYDLYFRDGQIVHAMAIADDLEGEEVLYALLTCREGNLEWEAAQTAPRLTINSAQDARFVQALAPLQKRGILEPSVILDLEPLPASLHRRGLPLPPSLSEENMDSIAQGIDQLYTLHANKFSGYVVAQTAENRGLMLFESGQPTAAHYYTPNQPALIGQDALRTLLDVVPFPTLQCYNADFRVLSAYRALLDGYSAYTDITTASSATANLLGMLTHEMETGVILVRTRAQTLYYLIYDGEPCGLYRLEARGQLCPVLDPVLPNGEAQYDVLLAKPLAFLELPQKTASVVFPRAFSSVAAKHSEEDTAFLPKSFSRNGSNGSSSNTAIAIPKNVKLTSTLDMLPNAPREMRSPTVAVKTDQPIILSLPPVQPVESGDMLLYPPLPPSSPVEPSQTLQDADLAKLVRSMMAQNLTGYMLCTVTDPAQYGLVIFERGLITDVCYGSAVTILRGQPAFLALYAATQRTSTTVRTHQCNPAILSAFRAVLPPQTAHTTGVATTTTIRQAIQNMQRDTMTGTIMVFTPTCKVYYLLHQGEMLGTFVVQEGMLQPSTESVFQSLDTTQAQLKIVLTPPAEDITLPSLAVSEQLPNAESAVTTVKGAVEGTVGGAVEGAVEGAVDWVQIIERGRRPYSDLPISVVTFNKLRSAFERGRTTGVIEIRTPTTRMYYLVEKGQPLGLSQIDIATRQITSVFASIVQLLEKAEGCFTVFLPLTHANTKQYYEDYLEALRMGAFTKATEVVQKALRDGVSREVIYDAIFTPSMRDIGLQWEKGAMSAAQEHLATGITEYCRTLVATARTVAPQEQKGRVLVVSVAGNIHTLGITLLADAFRWHGWEVFPLVMALPATEIAEAAFRYQVNVVCLSVMMPVHVEKATTAVRTLRQSGWSGVIEVGGGAFVANPDAFTRTGADFLGTTVENTVIEATRHYNLLRK